MTKKNSSQIVQNPKTKRWLIVPSKKFKAYQSTALTQLKAVGEPIDAPVNICYTFYMESRRPVDGLNLSAAMDDILVKAGILKDDNRDIVAGHDGTRVWYDKENPRTEITITRMDEYEQWSGKKA